LQLVIKGKFSFDGEEWEDISKEAKDLIKKMICKPERRLCADEVLDHKWVKNMTKGEQKEALKRIKNMGGLKKTQHYSKMQQAAMTAIAV
jgi:calcium-dependent protein kinase